MNPDMVKAVASPSAHMMNRMTAMVQSVCDRVSSAWQDRLRTSAGDAKLAYHGVQGRPVRSQTRGGRRGPPDPVGAITPTATTCPLRHRSCTQRGGGCGVSHRAIGSVRRMDLRLCNLWCSSARVRHSAEGRSCEKTDRSDRHQGAHQMS
jgi:hypothetical protein